jgi:membrane-bound serine protease (ClpP class)
MRCSSIESREAIREAWISSRPDRKAIPLEGSPLTAAVIALLALGSVLLARRLTFARSRAMAWAGAAAIGAALVLAVDSAGVAGLLFALVVPVAIVSFVMTVALTRVIVHANHRRSRCGAEALVGRLGVVRRRLEPVGQVTVGGELWRARRSLLDDDEPPGEGETVVVDGVHHLTLSVRRAESWEVES